MTTPGTSAAFVRWAALMTVFLYTAGYATIGFGLLFLGAVWHLIRQRSILWRPSWLDFPLAAFAAVLLAAAAVSPYHRLALGVTSILLISGAVYFGSFAWLLERDPGSRTALLGAWAAGAVLAALAGLVYSAISHARAQIPHGVGPNGLGTTLLLGSIVALGLAFRARGWERIGWTGSGLVSLAGLLASGSRASVVGWAAGGACLAYREFGARPRRMAVVLAAGLTVLVLAAAATPQLTGRVPNTLSDVSGNRIRIWHTSLAMIAARPWLGTGFGTFETAYERVKDPGMSREPFAFNLILNLAVETGLLGLLSAAWVAGVAIRVWRSPPPAGVSSASDPFRGLIAALWIGLLVDQLADNTLFSIGTSAGLWVLLALLVVPGSTRGGAGKKASASWWRWRWI